MIALGEVQILKIVKKVDFGVYLAADGEETDKVLLPMKQVPQGAKTGDELEVFIYRDSKDRLIATTRRPAIVLGGLARLRVVQTGKIGAFLDWGLEKDLLLPFKEQTKPVKEGEECLAALYIDKSGRLCATMNVYPYLRQDSTYQKDDKVTGTVYEISNNFGDLSIREKAYLQIGADAEKILRIIDSYDGVLPFSDKASPEVIKREMQMSKNEFKRAVGHLLKENKIMIGEKFIRRK